MRRSSHDDAVTGLGGPTALRNAIAGCSGPHALIVLDLDDFHAYNLAEGFAAGDALLRTVATRMIGIVPDGQVLRLPSDEFAMLVPCDDPAEARDIAHRLVASLTDVTPGLSACAGAVLVVTRPSTTDVSWDVTVELTAEVTAPEVDVRRTVQHVGLALHAARRAGAGSVSGLPTGPQVESSLDPPDGSGVGHVDGLIDASDHADLDVHTALRLGRFELYFQPLVSPATSRPLGLEALVRCCSDGAAPVGAEDIMPLVRRAGLSVEFGTTIIEQALARWTEGLRTAVRSAGSGGAPEPLLTVNIDVQQAQQEGFDALVLHLLARYGVAAQELVIEVAEPVLADQDAVQRLRVLRAAGVRVALDDFGAGPLVLSEIPDLPVDIIKVDQVLVGRLDPSAPDMGLIEDLQRLTVLLSIALAVEAVETPMLAQRIVALGVPLAQGYHYARPMPPEIAMAWLLGQVEPGAATPGAGGA